MWLCILSRNQIWYHIWSGDHARTFYVRTPQQLFYSRIVLDSRNDHSAFPSHISYLGVHLIYGRAPHARACISHMGVHLIYGHASMHLIHGCASHIWLCTSYMVMRLTYRRASMHLIYGRASHIWLCISYMVVHLTYGRASEFQLKV
jgi:hypothetical protein